MARVSDKQGRKLYETTAYDTREAAIADAFKARPNARTCSTSHAALIGGEWWATGMDIRWHDRRELAHS